MSIIGIVANPASGKDIRRLVARASVFDNQEKQAIVRRILAGIAQAAPDRDIQVSYLNDAHGIVREAAAEVLGCQAETAHLRAESICESVTGNALDTVAAARALKAQEAEVVITLGGDGTNRAFCKGWPDAALIPISTGTNNVFPELMEATIAGAAAGLIAGGLIPLESVAEQRKIINVTVDGEEEDIALIDAVFVSERFIGARALLNPEHLRSALLTVADPAAVGITAIGGLLEPVSERSDHGVLLKFGAGMSLRAPIAPGYYRDIRVADCRKVSFSHRIICEGPGVLAFDGERERVLKPGQKAYLTIKRTGPRVVDVRAVLEVAARQGSFRNPEAVDVVGEDA